MGLAQFLGLSGMDWDERRGEGRHRVIGRSGDRVIGKAKTGTAEAPYRLLIPRSKGVTVSDPKQLADGNWQLAKPKIRKTVPLINGDDPDRDKAETEHQNLLTTKDTKKHEGSVKEITMRRWISTRSAWLKTTSTSREKRRMAANY